MNHEEKDNKSKKKGKEKTKKLTRNTTKSKLTVKNKNEMYIVEKILNHRKDCRKKEISLLIKWVGYDDPTWETESLMRESINDDVDKYLEKQNKVVRKRVIKEN